MKTRRIIVLVVLCAVVALLSTAGTAVAATDPSVDWYGAHGSASDEYAFSVQQTTDGGYILAGTVLVSDAGNRKDVLLVKTDASGNQQWSRTFSGSGWDEAHGVVQTAEGGYAVVAVSGIRTSPGNSKGWLIKTDASGILQWSRYYGGGYYDCFDQVIQTADEGYVICGISDNANGVYPDVQDVWLLRTDASGNQQWSRNFGVGRNETAGALIQTTDGGFAIAGATDAAWSAGAEGWLVKTNASGELMWAKTYAGPNAWGVFGSLKQTTDGGYILAGGCGAVNPALVADPWLVKTDTSGNRQWSETYACNTDIAAAVFGLPGGGYLVAGTGCWSQDMSDSDLGLFTVDSSGGLLWELSFGGAGNDEVYAGSETGDGGWVLAGCTTSVGAGGADMWLVKVRPGSSGGGPGTFVDVPTNHPYCEAIEGMAGAGLVNGYPVTGGAEFRPGNAVWRAQFAKMIVGTVGFPCSEADICYFTDVENGGPTTLYPDNFIAVAAIYGVTNGIGGGRFAPYRDITRAQVITMVVRAAQNYMTGLRAPNAAYYATGGGIWRNFNDLTHGYNVQLAEFNGLLTGLQGSVDPAVWIWQPATRGEVAQILWNLCNAGLAG